MSMWPDPLFAPHCDRLREPMTCEMAGWGDAVEWGPEWVTAYDAAAPEPGAPYEPSPSKPAGQIGQTKPNAELLPRPGYWDKLARN